MLAPNPSDEIFGSKTVLLDAKRWDEAIALYDDVKGYGFQKKDASRDLSLELDPPAKNKNGEPLNLTFLMVACRKGELKWVKELISLNADPDAKTGCVCGVTPLMIAAEEGFEDAVEELLKAHADPNTVDTKAQRSPLMFAAQAGHEAAVELLLSYGAMVNAARKNGRTALHYACHHGYEHTARILIDADADINGENENGETPLMFACRYGHEPVAKMLLDKDVLVNKAMVSSPDGRHRAGSLTHDLGSTHVKTKERAPSTGEIEEPAAVQARYGDKTGWTSLHRACSAGHVNTVRLLLQKHETLLDIPNKKGVTPLNAASSSGYVPVVVMLMEKGADAKYADKYGQTAVYVAAKNGHSNTLAAIFNKCRDLQRSALLQKAATEPPRRKNKGESDDDYAAACKSHNEKEEPKTPLQIACLNGHRGATRVLLHFARQADAANVKLAVRYAAGIDTKGVTGPNALALAAKQGNKTIVKQFVTLDVKRDIFYDAAKKIVDEYNRAGGQLGAEKSDDQAAAIDSCMKVLEKYIAKPQVRRQLSRTLTQNLQQKATWWNPGVAVEKVHIGLDKLYALKDYKRQYPGQLVPPRPTQAEVHTLIHRGEGAEELDEKFILVEGAVVLQLGPFRGLFLRAGCAPRVSWHTLWETLKLCIEELHRREAAKIGTTDAKGRKVNPSAIYVVVAQRSMQAVDWMWLDAHNFRFHHQREARDGEDSGAEFVYYCWPGDPKQDMVPRYATSVEGATAILLHPDLEQVLLVWERGAWTTSGGAVDGGEGKLAALNREVWEELDVKLDLEWGAHYVGGYQQSRARDGVMNDNFSAFVVKLASPHFKPDNKEIMEAHFFPWRAILQKWRDAGSISTEKKVPLDVGKGDARALVHINVLFWLDMYEKGMALKCRNKEEKEMPKDEEGVGAFKLQWGLP